MDRLSQTDRSLVAGAIISPAGLSLDPFPPITVTPRLRYVRVIRGWVPLISNYSDTQVEVCQSDQKMRRWADRLNLPPCAGLNSG